MEISLPLNGLLHLQIKSLEGRIKLKMVKRQGEIILFIGTAKLFPAYFAAALTRAIVSVAMGLELANKQKKIDY